MLCLTLVALSVPVILAPHGLAAKLTGCVFSNYDDSTQKTLDEWRQFVAFPPDSSATRDDAPPLLVEVIVGKVNASSC